MAETVRKQDVATRIRDSLQSIIESWMMQVRREVPGAARLDDDSLKNSLPDFLKTLANVVSTTSESGRQERSSIETLIGSEGHGRLRAKQSGYSLDQVISEYRILRKILFTTLEATGEISISERRKLLESIDYGIMAAAVQFTAALGFKRASAADLEKKVLQGQLNESREERDIALGRSEELAKTAMQLQIERDMRERFVSALSHDLKNPLAAASMRVHLIRRQVQNSRELEALTAGIAQDLERADRMIGDLLDANRIRAGEKLALNIEQIDLTALIKTTLGNLAVVEGDRFVLRAPEKVDAFLDRAGIRRIIENLCNNAIKYGDPKAAVIVALEERGPALHIAVHNQGSALSLTDQKSLFDQFRRAETAAKSGKRGWGLGLTLVKGMAEAHGGTIKVESSVDTGTTFTVVLPRDARAIPGAAPGTIR